MECPNCSFQNTPGLRDCVRCRGLLDFSGVSIDPPRAADGRLARRVRSMGRAAGRRLGDSMADAARAVRIPLKAPVSSADLGWSLIPGMAQVRRGSQTLGWVLFSAWLALLTGAAAGIGSAASTLLALSAISVHCLVVSLLFNRALVALPVLKRAVVGLLIYASVVTLVYAPAYLVFRRVAGVLTVSNFHSGPIVSNGDTLLHTGAWTRPAAFDRGDLVVYDIDQARTGGAVISAGLGLERILGVPGDLVELDKTGLWLNGVEQPSELWPLGGLGRLPRLSLTASPGEYIIVPAALRWTAQGNAAALVGPMMGRIAHVRDDHIRGRVFWRARPWTRAGVPAAEPPP